MKLFLLTTLLIAAFATFHLFQSQYNVAPIETYHYAGYWNGPAIRQMFGSVRSFSAGNRLDLRPDSTFQWTNCGPCRATGHYRTTDEFVYFAIDTADNAKQCGLPDQLRREGQFLSGRLTYTSDIGIVLQSEE